MNNIARRSMQSDVILYLERPPGGGITSFMVQRANKLLEGNLILYVANSHGEKQRLTAHNPIAFKTRYGMITNSFPNDVLHPNIDIMVQADIINTNPFNVARKFDYIFVDRCDGGAYQNTLYNHIGLMISQPFGKILWLNSTI